MATFKCIVTRLFHKKYILRLRATQMDSAEVVHNVRGKIRPYQTSPFNEELKVKALRFAPIYSLMVNDNQCTTFRMTINKHALS